MGLSVDDILITKKNVFLLSGDRQYVADIESESNVDDFGDSVDVNPWNLYNEDGDIISNLFSTSDFNIRTQVLKTGSTLSPNNKNRHESFFMPTPDAYVGMCQVDGNGYSISKKSYEKFNSPITRYDGVSDSYSADYGFCQYNSVSSLKASKKNFIEPKAVYTPTDGVQYISEYPMSMFFSDFGDNDLDEEGSTIDVPTIYGDTYLTKYFYGPNYSIDARIDSSDSTQLVFDGMRTYYDIGYNGDSMYVVYRNDTNKSGAYVAGFEETNTPTTFELSTIGIVDDYMVLTYSTVDYATHEIYCGTAINSDVEKTDSFSNYFILRSWEPKDQSFILLAALTKSSANKEKAVAKQADTLIYVPRRGNVTNMHVYPFAYPEGSAYEPVSAMTFAELDYSVILGTTYNGSILVVSDSYAYQDPNFEDTNSITNFNPFIGPILAAHPSSGEQLVGSNSMPTVGYASDSQGRSEIYYNGSDILALKKYDVVDAVTSCRVFLSREFTLSGDVTFTAGRYFAALAPYGTDTSTISSYSLIPTTMALGKPIFDTNYVDLNSGYQKLELVPDNMTFWSVDDSVTYNGHNSIKISGTDKNESTYATLAINGAFTISFFLNIYEQRRHFPFTLSDTVNGNTSKAVYETTTNNTWKSITYTSVTDGAHTLKFYANDMCNGKLCKSDVIWITNVSIVQDDYELYASDVTLGGSGTIILNGTEEEGAAYSLKRGNYAFVQYDDGVVQMVHSDEILSNGGITVSNPCGPTNSVKVPKRVLKDIYFLTQSVPDSILEKTVGTTKFASSSKSSFTSMYTVKSALYSSYLEYGDDGKPGGNSNSYAVFPLSERESLICASMDSTHQMTPIEFSTVSSTSGAPSYEFITGYPLTRTTGVVMKRFASPGSMRNASLALVDWRYPNTGHSETNRNLDNPEVHIGYFNLQYVGVCTDLYETTTTKKETETSNETRTYTKTISRGYSYPHPYYGDIVTAGTGLRIFDGTFSKSVKVKDIISVNGYTVVANYSTLSHIATAAVSGCREWDIPFNPIPVSGGYVVIDTSVGGDFGSSDELYTVENVFTSDDSTIGTLNRVIPTVPLKAYPESNTGVSWAPYYAGKIIDFVRYSNGYYYIAVRDSEYGYDVVETDSLFTEHALVRLSTSTTVTDIRFFDGYVVVEYSINNVPNHLMWFAYGNSEFKYYFGKYESELASTSTNATKLITYSDGEYVIFGNGVYTAFHGTPDAVEDMSYESEISNYNYATYSMIPSSLLTFSASMNGMNGIVYNSESDSTACDSEIEGDDRSMPLSGMHNLFNKSIILTDDCDYEKFNGDGNGVVIKKQNTANFHAMLSTNSDGGTKSYVELSSGCFTFIGTLSTGESNYCYVFNKKEGKAYVSTDYLLNGVTYDCGDIFVEVSGTYDNAFFQNDYTKGSLYYPTSARVALLKIAVGGGQYFGFNPSDSKTSENLPSSLISSVCAIDGFSGTEPFFADDTIFFSEHLQTPCNYYFGSDSVYISSAATSFMLLTGYSGTVSDIIHPNENDTNNLKHLGACFIGIDAYGNSSLVSVSGTDNSTVLNSILSVRKYRLIENSKGTARALVEYTNSFIPEKYVNFSTVSNNITSLDYSSIIANSIAVDAENGNASFKLFDVGGNSNSYYSLIRKDGYNGGITTLETISTSSRSSLSSWQITDFTKKTSIEWSKMWCRGLTKFTMPANKLFYISNSDIQRDTNGVVTRIDATLNTEEYTDVVFYRYKSGSAPKTVNTFTESEWERVTVSHINQYISTCYYKVGDIVTLNGVYYMFYRAGTYSSGGKLAVYEFTKGAHYVSYSCKTSYTDENFRFAIYKKVKKLGIPIGTVDTTNTIFCSSTNSYQQQKSITNQPIYCSIDKSSISVGTGTDLNGWTYTYVENSTASDAITTTITMKEDGDGKLTAKLTFGFPIYVYTTFTYYSNMYYFACSKDICKFKFNSSINPDEGALSSTTAYGLYFDNRKLPKSSKKTEVYSYASSSIADVVNVNKYSEISETEAFLEIPSSISFTNTNNRIFINDDIAICMLPSYGMLCAKPDTSNNYITLNAINGTTITDTSSNNASYKDLYSKDTTDPVMNYDSVESIYSINRFTPQTLHKSNLFSIRIDDLGIDESPYLTEDGKTYIRQFVKNHVEDVVNCVKPAQTELFDVIFG